MKEDKKTIFMILIFIFAVSFLSYIIYAMHGAEKELELTCKNNNMVSYGYYCVDTNTGALYSPKWIKENSNVN